MLVKKIEIEIRTDNADEMQEVASEIVEAVRKAALRTDAAVKVDEWNKEEEW